MNLRALFSRPSTWWTVAIGVAFVLCAAAVNNTVYESTSPPSYDYHVILRKVYSIIAFAAVGFPTARARQTAGAPASLLAMGGIIAGYSALIEVLQFFLDPPYEGLPSSLLDVALGFVGGAIGALIAARFASRHAP